MSRVTAFESHHRGRPRRWPLGLLLVAVALTLASCGDAMESPFGMTEEVASTIDDTTTSTAAEGGEDEAGSETPTESTITPAVGEDDAEGAAGDGAAPSGAPLQGLGLEEVATGLAQPTVVTAVPDDDRLFVVERQGVIRVIDGAGDLADDPFLDLRDRVLSDGIEQGMLGLAFHPDYASNGRLFVYYIDRDGRRQLSEFAVSADPSRGDPESEKVLFELEHPPDSNDVRHYAGAVHFGPDGYLYVSLGDGADARGQGQNPDSMFAAIVRLDVDGGDPYAIPSDNPFVAGGGAPEVWAYGLRNPWRFAIDHEERLLYVADVGQEAWEEVNVVPLDGSGGTNFGWITTEGAHCFSPADCDMTGIMLPVLEYDHDEGCSIIGGFVYRGAAIPELQGHYFYADWCGLWVRSFRYENGAVTQEQDWANDLAEAGQVNTFGIDGAGELYIANFEGNVLRIVPVR